MDPLIAALHGRADTKAPELPELTAEELEAQEHMDALEDLADINGRKEKPSALDMLIDDEYEDEDEDLAQEPLGYQVDEAEYQFYGKMYAEALGGIKKSINRAAKRRFDRELKERFNQEDLKTLDGLIFLDKKGELNANNIAKIKSWAQEYNKSFPEFISIYTQYIEIKDRFQTSEYEDWQKDLVQKYATEVAAKYMVGGRITPEVKLMIITAYSIGYEAVQVFWNVMQDFSKKRKAKREEKED